MYRIYTSSDPVIDCISDVSPKVVKNAFKLLDFVSSKNWSGFQFFGFDRADVMQILTRSFAENEISSSDAPYKKSKTNTKPQSEINLIRGNQNNLAKRHIDCFDFRESN